MGILRDLVTELQAFPETTDSEPAAENSQEGSDLFLEVNQSSTGEAIKEKVRGGTSCYSDLYLMDVFPLNRDHVTNVNF